MFPMVPLGSNLNLGIAIVSYNGKLNFGLVGDFNALPDLEDLAGDFLAALNELADAAGIARRADGEPSPVARLRRRDGGEDQQAPQSRRARTSWRACAPTRWSTSSVAASSTPPSASSHEAETARAVGSRRTAPRRQPDPEQRVDEDGPPVVQRHVLLGVHEPLERLLHRAARDRVE